MVDGLGGCSATGPRWVEGAALQASNIKHKRQRANHTQQSNKILEQEIHSTSTNMFLLFQAIKIITSPKGSPPRGARPLSTLPPSPCDAPDSQEEPGRAQSEFQQHTYIVTETPVQCKPNNTMKSKNPCKSTYFPPQTGNLGRTSVNSRC